MGVFKTADGRTLVGIGQQDGNEYSGFNGWRDCVIQLTASGATENSVKYLNAIKDYAIAHNAKGESIMPPNLSIWISNNGATTAVQADDIAVDGANVTICGIKWNGTAWDYTDAGKGGDGGGASSLADLSDVEIDTSSPDKKLLKYNSLTQKWENVSDVRGLLTYPNSGSNQGAVCISDSEEVLSAPPVVFSPSSQEAFLLTSIIGSAIDNGQGQTDNLPKDAFRNLILSAAQSVRFNIPSYFFIGNDFDIEASLSLDSATPDYATFVGTYFHNLKFYRITLIIYCPNTAKVATVLAKAEELMTYTEPT